MKQFNLIENFTSSFQIIVGNKQSHCDNTTFFLKNHDHNINRVHLSLELINFL